MRTEWNTYHTRFLVRARQLTEPLYFLDALGREHYGQAGDYLVEASHGLRSTIPRQLFEDIYVPMAPAVTGETMHSDTTRRSSPKNVQFDDHRNARPITV
jgi:hypothetical protein